MRRGGGRMQRRLRSFLDYLRLNRNVSRHTARAYEGDLAQFLAFAHDKLGRAVRPDDFDHRLVRAFLGELYARGRARASSAPSTPRISGGCRGLGPRRLRRRAVPSTLDHVCRSGGARA